MSGQGSSNVGVAGLSALLRVRELHIEQLSAALAAGNEAKAMSQHHAKTTLQLALQQSGEYNRVVQELALSKAEHSTREHCLADESSAESIAQVYQSVASFGWESTILSRTCDILPRILLFFGRGDTFHSTEEAFMCMPHFDSIL